MGKEIECYICKYSLKYVKVEKDTKRHFTGEDPKVADAPREIQLNPLRHTC